MDDEVALPERPDTGEGNQLGQGDMQYAVAGVASSGVDGGGNMLD
jgi:hypothetical protein